MEDRRKHERFEFNAKCLLKTSDGNTSQVVLNDMSLGGALVMKDGDITVCVDELCHLILGESSDECPLIRTSKVVRVDENKIGLSFPNEDEPLTVYKP
ncbi:MAG: PilZ domain-containing protein [Desulfuromonadaceae bacterium]|nr:PilZ domain-containing protein [Desulfuromonadaceae bacterium]MDD5107224.1 PilZ domain-containing protein [Desulfuromonadaceae bacterium]